MGPPMHVNHITGASTYTTTVIERQETVADVTEVHYIYILSF